jgi:hypothetical protein
MYVFFWMLEHDLVEPVYIICGKVDNNLFIGYGSMDEFFVVNVSCSRQPLIDQSISVELAERFVLKLVQDPETC